MWWSEAAKAVNRSGRFFSFLPEKWRIGVAKLPWYKVNLGNWQPLVFQFFNGWLAGIKQEILVRRDEHRFGGGVRMDFAMELDLSSYVGRKYFYADEDYWFGTDLKEKIRPGEVYFDVGASVGYTSLTAAAVGAKVLAFEVDEKAYRRLAKNAALNTQLEIRIFNVAASDHDGREKFYLSESMDGGHSLEKNYQLQMKIPQTGERMVDVRRLEGMASERPAIIKIDVEGHEKEVLRGLGAELDGVRYLYCESTPQNWEEVKKLVGEHGLAEYFILNKATGRYEKGVDMQSWRLFDARFHRN